VPLDSVPTSTGAARQFWIAKIDSRQVAVSMGGMGKTMRAHMAKLEEVQSQVDEAGWSVQWSTRRNVRSAEMRECKSSSQSAVARDLEPFLTDCWWLQGTGRLQHGRCVNRRAIHWG